ncbi:type VI secretion system baseplate subunit TssG [Legionella spiritensis]|uniref:type VI secretion system baseplate subunit TssG n=1 Tax=Legionella spiritensis TaxID=452 RepID=UPI000F6D0618|nr:type VI secretion system baseplate subunit TssG [Legionella spiritensis]VEG90605.1 Uncharacterized protein conserved in bacteria [Legionella spiritensis]
MDTTIEQSRQHLINELIEKSSQFNFYQVVRLIRHLIAQNKESLTFRSPANMAHPAADIEQIQFDQNTFKLDATFLSLTTASSPLPDFYTESILQDLQNDSTAVQELMDIIHQRLYQLLFESWTNHSFLLQINEYNNATAIDALYSFMGLADHDIRHSFASADSLLKFICYLSSSHKSIRALSSLLSKYFKTTFTVHSFQYATQDIPPEQHNFLGVKNNRLSETAYLGCEFSSCSNSLLIQIGPLTAKQFPQYLANTRNIKLLKEILSLYVNEPFGFFIEVILDKSNFEPASLCHGFTNQLGITSWLAPIETIENYTVHYWL